MSRQRVVSMALALLSPLTVGCTSEEPPNVGAVMGTTASFELDADLSQPEQFYALPWPSDLRLSPDGKPELGGFLGADNVFVARMLPAAAERPGWPATPVAYFEFDAPIAKLDPDRAIAADVASPVLLVGIDGHDRGKLYPTIALDLPADRYTPANTLAVASYPGIVLGAGQRYAVVVKRELRDEQGELLGVSESFVRLANGASVTGAHAERARELHQPLWQTLEAIGVPREDVAAATVFTVGDVVRETLEVSLDVLADHDVVIEGLALDQDDGADHERFCELVGTIELPQFQKGAPPFNSDGYFERDLLGKLVVQRTEVAKVVITLPKKAMPLAGYPLVLYIHGSGGLAGQLVDRGKIDQPDTEPKKGTGPAHVIAEHGFAGISLSMPQNPERVPGSGSFDYINPNNLGPFASTFRQGIFDLRLLIEALPSLAIDPAALAGCSGASLPATAAAYRFDLDRLVGMGQSMGAQYLNLVAAVEPRIGALAPTGAGGLWSTFMVASPLFDGVVTLVSSFFDTPVQNLTPLHPALQLLQLAWEPGDALHSLPRLARRPFEGHPVRSIYEPVAPGDAFFPESIFQAMAIGYGNQQAGEMVWPELQQALKVAGLDGIASYPASFNRKSESGVPYTGVVVQHQGDGIADPHSIFSQLDAVKYQYGCFFASFVAGKAVVPSPKALGTPCR